MSKSTQKYLWDTQIENQKNIKHYLSVLYTNMGLTTVEVRKKYLAAHENYIKSLKMCKNEKIQYGILLNYINIGKNAKKWGKLDLSIAMMDSALTLIETMNLPSEKMELLKNRASLFEELKNFQKAYINLKDADIIEREIYNKEKLSRLDKLTVKYESTLKEKELEKRNIELVASIQNRILLMIIFSIILIILGLIIQFYIFRIRNLKYLYHKNLEILKIYEEKKNLIKKNNHLNSFENRLRINFDHLMDQINDVLINEESFKDPDLNLSLISTLVKSNSKYVSQAIQKHTNQNFNTYINHLRLMEAKKIIRDSYGNINFNEVMNTCGFKSRTAFYTSFINETGMSPKQFRDFTLTKEMREIEEPE